MTEPPRARGAHSPGLEKGPAAVRAAGLVGLLPGEVDDHGDVAGVRWRPDREDSNQQNVAPVARVASETMAGVARILRQGQVPLVIGGDCSITIGVIASFARVDARPALLYVDGGPDLYPPDTRPNGNLDAMGMAHLLAIPGHVPEVAGIGPTVPLLMPDKIVSYGHTLPGDDPALAAPSHSAISPRSSTEPGRTTWHAFRSWSPRDGWRHQAARPAAMSELAAGVAAWLRCSGGTRARRSCDGSDRG